MTHLWLNSNVTHCCQVSIKCCTMLEKLLDSLGAEAKAPERSQKIIWFCLSGASNLQLQLDPTCHKIKSDQQVEAAAPYSNVKAGLVTVLLPFIILFQKTYNNLDILKLLANSWLITHLADTRKHSHNFSSVFSLHQILREMYVSSATKSMLMSTRKPKHELKDTTTTHRDEGNCSLVIIIFSIPGTPFKSSDIKLLLYSCFNEE